MQVIEECPPGAADEAAVQAARLGAEQLEGLGSATPLRALRRDQHQCNCGGNCPAAAPRLLLPRRHQTLPPGSPR